MSHKATNWAFDQRGLKPATRVVLLYLADRHNPDHGCFPSQDQLAADCEMSRRSVNDQLDQLEEMGLIRRERRIHPDTRKQMSTRYILGFEPEFTQEPCANSAHGNTPEPCANFDKSRVQILHTNPVKEPVITTTDFDPESDDLGLRCLEACGPGLTEVSRGVIRDTDEVIDGWLADGIDLDLDVLPVLRRRTEAANGRTIRTWDYFTDAIRREHARRSARVARPDRAENSTTRTAGVSSRTDGAGGTVGSAVVDPVVMMADWVNSDRYLPGNAVSNRLRDELLARGLVTHDRLRDRGIY